MRPNNSLSPQAIDAVRQEIGKLLRDNPDLFQDVDARADMIEGETDAYEVLSCLEMRRQETQGWIGALAVHIDNLKGRKMRLERQEEGWRRCIQSIMEAGNLRQVRRPEATLSISPSPPRVIVTEPEKLPSQFMLQRDPVPDLKALASALKDGPIEGCHLSNAPPMLRILTK